MNNVSIAEVSPGMVVGQPIYSPETGKLLLSQGTKLTKQLIDSMKKRGISNICINERYTLDLDPLDSVRDELKTIIDREIVRLAPEKIEGNTTDLMSEVSKRARVIAENLINNDRLVKVCVEMKILSNDYLYKHCAGTCALALLVAGAMGLDESKIYDIGAGALIHDMGMCEMPFLIIPREFSKQEELLWKEHPTYGYYFAKEAGLSESIAQLVLHHHEKWNGTGFPNGISDNQIPLGARIIAVCQSYNRLMCYENYPEYQAIEYLYGSGNYLFDAEIVNVFTNNLAVYPLGSLVRLSTGESGIVVNVRKNSGPRPIVCIYYNRVNRPLSRPKYIDLAEERTIFIKEVLQIEK